MMMISRRYTLAAAVHGGSVLHATTTTRLLRQRSLSWCRYFSSSSSIDGDHSSTNATAKRPRLQFAAVRKGGSKTLANELYAKHSHVAPRFADMTPQQLDDPYTVRSAMKSWWAVNDVESARAYFEKGTLNDQQRMLYAERVLQMYRRRNDIDGTRDFIANAVGGYDRMNAESIAGWIRMLGTKDECVDEATTIWEWCKQHRRVCIRVSSAIMYTYGRNAMAPRYLEQVRTDMSRFHVAPNASVYGSLIKVHVNVNNVRRAMEAFKEMIDHDLEPTNQVYYDLFRCFGESGDLLSLDDCVAYMLKSVHTNKLSPYVYEKLLQQYVTNDRLEHATQLIDKLRHNRYRFTQWMGVQAIRAYCKINDVESAMEMYHGIVDEAHDPPSEELITTVLQLLPRRYDTTRGEAIVRRLHDDVEKFNVWSTDVEKAIAYGYSLYSVDAVIAYSNQIQQKQNVTDDTVHTLHVCITRAYRRSRRADDGYAYLTELLKDTSNVIPIDCFNFVASAYMDSGRVLRARLTLRHALHKLKLTPNARTFNLLVQIAWIDQKFNRALKYWREMMKYRFEPTRKTLDAIMRVFKRTNAVADYGKLHKLLAERDIGLTKTFFGGNRKTHSLYRPRTLRAVRESSEHEAK